VTRKHDPKLYLDLAQPFSSEADAEQAIKAFFADVEAARARHRMPDVYLVAQYGIAAEDGAVGEYLCRLQLGDPLHSVMMLAQAYADEKRTFREWLGLAESEDNPPKSHRGAR
jgi:hypothetical protein